MNSTSNKFIIVTGANKGIGLQIVKDLLKLDANYSVILTSRDIKRGQEAIKAIEETQNVKDRLYYEQLDIESEDSINAFVEIVKKKYKSIYILINNAAVLYEEVNGLEDFANAQIDEKKTKTEIKINVRGTIIITEKIIPYLQENGRIIFLSSLAGLQQYHKEEAIKRHNDEKLTEKGFYELLDEYETYAVKKEHVNLGYFNSIYFGTKLFLNTYVRSILNNSLKKNQTAFAVHPGVIKTDMGSFADTPVEEATVSTLKTVNFTEKEALEHNLKFFDDKGNVQNY